MALEMWETIKQSITAYTGLSPATFFTVVALALVTYYVLSGLFGSSSSSSYHGGHDQRSMGDFEDSQPLPPPVQVGEISDEELKQYDGSDPNKPLLMAIKGQIYDVSHSRVFYGPGGPYALFAGKDASRALAKMSFEEKDLTGDISGLGIFELEALQDWEYRFMSKYVKVGTVKTSSVPVSDASTNGEPSHAANGEVSRAADAAEHDATKPAEVNERDIATPTEATEQDGAKPAEGSPSETANGDSAGGTSAVDAKKKD